MLAEATRLARLVTAATDQAYLKRRAQAAAVTSGAWAVAGLMTLLALLFVQIAIFAALLEVMPAWGAALVVAAIAVILAGIAVLVANRRGRHEPLPRNDTFEAFTRDPNAAAADAMAPLVDEAFRATRERPGETMLLALGAGMIVGRMLRRPRR
jgi:hypothetical protein